MKNLITLAAALMIGAGMSAFAQGDAPAPGDSKPAAPSAPAKAKKAKHGKKKSKDEAPKAQ